MIGLLKKNKVGLILLFSLTSLLFAAVFFLNNNYLNKEADLIEASAIDTISSIKENGSNTIREVISNIVMMKHIIEAHDFIDVEGESSSLSVESRSEIESYLYSWISAHHGYFQIRILGLDGMELVRLHQYGSVVSIVPEVQLQDKSDRYYYTDAINLNDHDIYVSDLDLNIENNEIELVDGEVVPTLRFVTPIYNTNNEKAAYMVVNFYAKQFIEISDALRIMDETSFLNKEGFYLNSSNDDILLFSFMYDEDHNEVFSQYHSLDLFTLANSEIDSLRNEGVIEVFSKLSFYDIENDVNTFLLNNEIRLITAYPDYYIYSNVDVLQTSRYMNFDYYLKIASLFGFIFIVILSIYVNYYYKNRKEYIDAIQYSSQHDHLTGLKNRAFFINQIQMMLDANIEFTILFLDLDKFKEVNDTYGHDIGDKVLIESSHRIQSNLRVNDVLARLGGDEFSVCLIRVSSKKDIQTVVEKIVKSFELQFIIDDCICDMGISIGASSSKNHTDASEMLKEADQLMYQNKKNRR